MTQTPPTPEEGLEVQIVPEGNAATAPDQYTTYTGGITWSAEPYEWASVTIGYPTVALNGQRINVRYFTENLTTTPGEEDPENPGQYLPDEYELTRSYPPFYVVSASIIPLAPHNQLNPFFTENDPVTEFILPEVPSTYSGGSYAVSGITDGTEYYYPKVFDQTQGKWIGAFLPYDSTTTNNAFFPTEPTEYPMDALVQFIPDEREVVTVTYQLTIGYNLTGEEDPATETEIITVKQDVYQDLSIFPAIVAAMASNTNYSHNYRPQKPITE